MIDRISSVQRHFHAEVTETRLPNPTPMPKIAITDFSLKNTAKNDVHCKTNGHTRRKTLA